LTDPILTASELSRSYGKFQALAPIDLALTGGEITALTGPNGAGKTTLLLCLSGLLRPSRGEVKVEGFDLYRDERQAKQRLAFVPDVPRFYQELTAWEHLRFVALAHNAGDGFERKAEGLLREFGLWEAKDLYPHHFSRGMRLKLGLLLALIRPFKVLLLDEPTSALDPDATALLVQKLHQLRYDGSAILLSTHSPELIGKAADRQVHLAAGQVAEV
jgi:ABC-2 type transport system ATP-binding protein